MKNICHLQLAILLSLLITAYCTEDYYEEYVCRKIFTPHGLRLSACTDIAFGGKDLQNAIKARYYDYIRIYAYKSYIDRMRREEDDMLTKYHDSVEAKWSTKEARKIEEKKFDLNEQHGPFIEEFSDI